MNIGNFFNEIIKADKRIVRSLNLNFNDGCELLNAYDREYLVNSAEELLDFFPIVVSLVESFFHENNKKNPRFKTSSALLFILYDLVLNSLNTFCRKSVVASGANLRASFEFLVLLKEIERDLDHNLFKWNKYKEVLRLKHKLFKNQITEEECMDEVRYYYNEWYDPDPKKFRDLIKFWTAKPSDNIKTMAKRNELSSKYEEIYYLYSKVTHLEPLIVNAFKHGPIADSTYSHACLAHSGDHICESIKIMSRFFFTEQEQLVINDKLNYCFYFLVKKLE